MAFGGRTIVYIDDDPDSIKLVDFILRPLDLDFIAAPDGHRGLEAIRESNPDLVLLDLILPDMDGWQVYEQMLADDETKDIPVIVVTARIRALDRQSGHFAEVAEHLTKPLVPQELLRAVTRLLEAAP